ncbi:MAG: hypothetical protein WD944_06475 [Steroidobacteraceae bacterium]
MSDRKVLRFGEGSAQAERAERFEQLVEKVRDERVGAAERRRQKGEPPPLGDDRLTEEQRRECDRWNATEIVRMGAAMGHDLLREPPPPPRYPTAADVEDETDGPK